MSAVPNAAPPAAPPAAPVAGPPAAGDPWFKGMAGVDTETVGVWTNKGWHTKTAAEVALEATKAFREAEKFIGAPPDQLLRLPKDAADEQGWNTLYSRLGRPADAKGYDFSTIKNADGTALDENFANTMREAAFKLNLPKTQAEGLTGEVAKLLDNQRQSAKIELEAKLVTERAALAKDWGANFDANKFVASRAAAALGLDPQTVSALEGVVGYAKIMEMFRNIGTKIGEDKFIGGGQGGGNGVMTVGQAQAKLTELKADKAFVTKYMAGDIAARREMDALHVIIASAK